MYSINCFFSSGETEKKKDGNKKIVQQQIASNDVVRLVTEAIKQAIRVTARSLSKTACEVLLREPPNMAETR